VEKTSRLRSRDPVASGVKCGPHGGMNSKMKSWTVGMTMPAPTASPTTFPISTRRITRSRAKKIEQEVHTLLYEFQLNTNDNSMLPKSCMLILLRYVEDNHQDKGPEARIGKSLVIRQGHSTSSSNQQVIRQAIRQGPESDVRALNCTNLRNFT
jgi:hypothetical protein